MSLSSKVLHSLNLTWLNLVYEASWLDMHLYAYGNDWDNYFFYLWLLQSGSGVGGPGDLGSGEDPLNFLPQDELLGMLIGDGLGKNGESKFIYNTLLKPKRHSLRSHGFVVHALLLRMNNNVVDFRVMRRLCHREWNWQGNWQSVNHIPGICDNGPRDHGVWRLTLTAYYIRAV